MLHWRWQMQPTPLNRPYWDINQILIEKCLKKSHFRNTVSRRYKLSLINFDQFSWTQQTSQWRPKSHFSWIFDLRSLESSDSLLDSSTTKLFLISSSANQGFRVFHGFWSTLYAVCSMHHHKIINKTKLNQNKYFRIGQKWSEHKYFTQNTFKNK